MRYGDERIEECETEFSIQVNGTVRIREWPASWSGPAEIDAQPQPSEMRAIVNGEEYELHSFADLRQAAKAAMLTHLEER